MALGMAFSDPPCRQPLKLIMRSGQKEKKKQKLLESLRNVGMALSDPRCRQSRSSNEADTLLLAHCHTGYSDEEDDQLQEVLTFRQEIIWTTQAENIKALNRIFFGHSIISVMKKKMW